MVARARKRLHPRKRSMLQGKREYTGAAPKLLRRSHAVQRAYSSRWCSATKAWVSGCLGSRCISGRANWCDSRTLTEACR